RKCRTIGNECRVFGILIGADQKAVTPVALDGCKIEVVEGRNAIVARRMLHPVLKDAANVSSSFGFAGCTPGSVSRFSKVGLRNACWRAILAAIVEFFGSPGRAARW